MAASKANVVAQQPDLPITIEREREQNGYLAYYPGRNGLVARGQTHEEAIANLKQLEKLWLDAQQIMGGPLPERSHVVSVRFPSPLYLRLKKAASGRGLSPLIVSLVEKSLGDQHE